ncbi:MAG: TonB-dependent receptor, partial [Acidobacteriaceae bacterium]|nr:TonB-dependent receptor [Acidobacteriaceae bacterium]
GMTYGIQQTQDRESIVNLHFAVPHHNGTNKDDIQALYLSSFILMPYYSSVDDLGGPSNVYYETTGSKTGTLTFGDGWVYNGAMYAPPVRSDVVPYLYPSTPHYWGEPVPTNLRDTNSNEVQIGKLQYQRNFSSTSYLRLFGYGMYSTWFIHGLLGGEALGFCCYGGEIGDYELPVHTYGGVIDYSNQLSDKNLLTVGGFYNSIHIQRYTTTNGFPGRNGIWAIPNIAPGVPNNGYLFATPYGMMNNVDGAGNCYGAGGIAAGPVTCFGSPVASGNPNQGTILNIMAGTLPFAPTRGTGWLATENGYSYNFNKVHPVFSAFSVNDNWHPDDRLTVNIGVRVENYAVGLNDSTVIGYDARQFWFNAYNREYCFGPGYFQPLYKGPTGTCAADFPLTNNVNFVNTNPSSFSHTVWQPRLGTTYTLNANDVLRFSAGLYARPASTRDASWNTGQQNLASFLGQNFAVYGQYTPNHDLLPDQSTNFDLSWEHHFSGTQLSMKITPYWRSTENQVQQTIVNALSELFADFNTGHLVSTGVEFALNGGSFAHNGLAFQFAYTYNNSHISYHDFPNTSRNVIDNMNSYIQLYNSFTSACAGATPTTSNTAMCGPFGSLNVGTAATNPWFVAPAQPLLSRTGTYAPYDLVPVPYAGANGYEVPDVATLVLNYKYNKWNFAPTFAYSAGTVYGSPLAWEAVAPTSVPGKAAFAVTPNCTAVGTVQSASCGVPLMVPDPYTGHFDTFGEFQEPSRLTLNMAIGYEFTPQVSGTVTLSNIMDQCYQRHYPWDAAHTCIYSNLPSFFLQPIGSRFYNDLGLANSSLTPPQLKYPYAMWLNNNNTGFVGVSMPFQASFEINWKT